MVMRLKVVAGLLAALGVAACVQAQTRERQQERLDELLPYAGEPVDSFRFWNLTQWELVGSDKVVVWPRLQEAFLITVDEPCTDLEWAKSIAVTSSAQRVTARFDSVKAGKDRCRIKEIRPLDMKRYQRERKAARQD